MLQNTQNYLIQIIEKVINIKSDYAEAYYYKGISLREIKLIEKAIENYEKAFKINPNLNNLFGSLVFAKHCLCDWKFYEKDLEILEKEILKNKNISKPFTILSIFDSSPLQRISAEINVKDKFQNTKSLGPILKREPSKKIRLGYYSSDFRNHAMSYLLAGLFELHDKSKFELIAFSLGPEKKDEMTERIASTFDKFIETNYSKAEVSPVTGSASIMGTLTDLIARGQLRSLAISLVLVFLVTSLVFRSFQAGLYSVFPLGGAVILVFGFMAYFGIELNTATSMLTSILIGVGIDYTIHFLWHYRQFVRKGMDGQEAVIQTLTTSGKGIIFNAFSVMVGFIILMVSGFLPIFFFGFVIIFSIGMCLIGALALLPALVVWTKPRFIFGEAKSES